MRRRNSLQFDLTPLLDVILIILFLVLLTSHKQTQHAVQQAEDRAEQAIAEVSDDKSQELAAKQTEIDELEQKLAKSQDENRLLREFNEVDTKTLEALDVLKQQTITYRIEVPDDYPAKPLLLTDSQTTSSQTFVDQVDLTKSLHQKLSASDDVVFILILEYNNKKILLKDYRKINQSLLQLRADINRTILYREIDRANPTGR